MKTIFNDFENKPGVYKIYNKINDRIYIGSTKEFNTRYNKHLSTLRKNKHCNNFLQHDFNKCGEENFVFEIIEITSKIKEERIKLEQYYIDKFYDNQQQCYNLCPIAHSSLGRKWQQSSRENASKYWTEFYKIHQHHNLGKPCLEKTKKKISEAQKGEKNHAFGKPVSKEIIKKRIEGLNKARTEGRLSGNRGKIPWNKGCKMNPKELEYHANKRKKNYNIILISPNGEIFNGLTDIKNFCKKHDLNYGNFNSLINGKRKQCKGWRIHK